ncbi:13881_t:CDS:2, partial [Racocetra fulgida]
MSLQNFSNDEYAYSEESQLLPNEESSELLSKESPLLSDKQQPLSLDKDPLLLDDELSLDEPSIDSKPVSDEESLLLLEGSSNSTQNTITEASKSSQQNIIVKRKSNSNLRNNNANKKSKPEKSWVWHYMKKDKPAKIIYCRAWVGDDNLKQCTSTFEIATSTTNLASHLRTVHRLSKTGPLLPLSGEKETVQLQPVRLDLSQSTLLELVNHLAKDKERDVRNNAKALEKLLLDDDDLLGIQELVELLGPFAHVTTIVGGDHYPTLSMMLPLVRILQEHLYQKEETLTHPIIRDVRDEIELSFGERWEEPGPEGYVAAMLDPRFKDLGFEPAKFESTKDELKCRMMEYIENNNYSLPNNNLPTSLLSSLFEETTHQS